MDRTIFLCYILPFLENTVTTEQTSGQPEHYKAQAAGMREVLLLIMQKVDRDFEGFVMPPEAAVIANPKPDLPTVQDAFQLAKAMLVSPPSGKTEFGEAWGRLAKSTSKSDDWRNWHRTDIESRRVLRSEAMRPIVNASLFATTVNQWCVIECLANSETNGRESDIFAVNIWEGVEALMHDRSDILVVAGGVNCSEAVRRLATEMCAAAGMTGGWHLGFSTKHLFRAAPLERTDPPGSVVGFPDGFMDNIVFDSVQDRYRLKDEPHPRD